MHGKFGHAFFIKKAHRICKVKGKTWEESDNWCIKMNKKKLIRNIYRSYLRIVVVDTEQEMLGIK